MISVKRSVQAALRGSGALFILLLVPVGLTLGSIRLLVTSAYLQIEYNKADFPPDVYGFTLADRLHYAPFAVNYMIGGPADALAILTFPDGRPFYNNRELQHMADVRQVTQTAFAVGLLLFAVGLLVGLLLARSERGRLALRSGLIGGALLTIAAIVALAVGVLLAWDTFFTMFHELFFAAGSWTFDYTDSLIRLFPERFWQDAALTIGGLTLTGALIVLAAAWRWARRSMQQTAGSGA